MPGNPARDSKLHSLHDRMGEALDRGDMDLARDLLAQAKRLLDETAEADEG